MARSGKHEPFVVRSLNKPGFRDGKLSVEAVSKWLTGYVQSVPDDAPHPDDPACPDNLRRLTLED